jgi:hypothetical protein|tara:strand:- start:312 stop:560 length:249 start_codon:yes stop_codon:yes gene_type:complete
MSEKKKNTNKDGFKKRSWCMEITLRRTFDGLYEDAVALAHDDFDWFFEQVDGGDNVNLPCGLTIKELPQGEGYIKSKEITLI